MPHIAAFFVYTVTAKTNRRGILSSMDNPERVTYFAATDNRGRRTPFGIKQKDRSKHMYIIGKTGMGKSTLIENLVIQDLRNGEGLALIDPHGATADKILSYVPPERVNDVVYVAPFDLEHPIAFNVMEDVGYDKRHLVVSGLMATFKKIWVDAWSARMEYILSNTLLALLEYPDATLLGVNRMYTDKAYRKKVVDNVKDPVVKDFWTKEFAGYTDRFTQEATPAIQNKVGQFISNPLIRNIIGQPKSSFDIRKLMDERKILIVNLSKGQVGETNMRLLGSMITTRIFLAAMSRADLSEGDIKKLPNFYFYVDEFQNFANDTFADILSEARKYKLNLVIANQYIKQLEANDDTTVKDAVFGNVGTTIAFRVGPFDAEQLETVFLPEFTKEDLVNLGFAQIYLSLMIDGVGSRPFSATTIPPIEAPAKTFREEVITASRRQFAGRRADIEASLIHELGEAPPETPQGVPDRAQKKPQGDARRDEPRRDEPRREAFKKEDRPQQSGQSVRPGADRARRPSPQSVPPQKSASDLKDILRTLASEKEQKPTPPKAPGLKDALKQVLQAAPQPAKIAAPTEATKLPPVEQPQALASKPPKPAFPEPTPPQELLPRPEEKNPQKPAPYEVPEEVLRKVFRGEDV